MITLFDKIQIALQKNLPGPRSHEKMLPPKRKLEVAEKNFVNSKRSSVLLLLFEDNSELMACLIKRTNILKHHAGQIALPGGRIEKGETALETALRETREEIGIGKEQITILGSLSELYVSVSDFIIHPFVGWLEKKPEFNTCKEEVEKVILFPIMRYKNVFEEEELETISGKLNVPCIHFKGETIWGATAMILSEFYDLFDS